MKRKILAWAIPGAAIPALLLLAFGLTRNPQFLPSALIGREAPDFRLTRMAAPRSSSVAERSGEGTMAAVPEPGEAGRPAGDGLPDEAKEIVLSDLRGRVVILNFWASWCAPCRAEHPVLVRTDETYDRDDVVLLGVLYQDTEENGRRFMSEFGGDWPTVLDPNSRTALDYGVYGAPETFFIGADGRVAKKHLTPVTWELVSQTVDSLLMERAARGSYSDGEAEPPVTMPEEQVDPAEGPGS